MVKAIIFDYYGVIYLSTPQGKRVNQALVDAIWDARGKYKLGALSNIQRTTLDSLLANHGLDGAFDAVLASSETNYMKPEPQIFELLLQQLGVQPEETVFIDDLAENVQAAAQLGMAAHQFTDNASLANFLEKRGTPLTLSGN